MCRSTAPSTTRTRSKCWWGRTTLTANGIDIPDVAGAVFSGTASGDWTLSCVRGQVRSITFVFNDGTIRTIPEDREGNQQNNQQRDGLGWISDPHGIPCVSGERRSNAQQYLGSAGPDHRGSVPAWPRSSRATAATCPMSARTAPSAPWASAARGGRPDSGGRRAGHVGLGQQALRQAFAAVYVQPGAKVAVHLEKPLAIDFDPEGRKVDHRTGESHALELE